MNEHYGYGPIWIDPRFLQQHRYRTGDWWETITTNTTQPVPPRVVPASVDEERIREIVREEMADLVNPDVPGAPPEDWR